MEEIKVGDYIRTEDGIIDRIVIAENDDEMYAGERDPEYLDYVREDIIKHSSNIIDLIEIGDFINGKMCIDIEHYTRDDGSNGINFVCIGGSVLKENIKSIVTKEQIAAVEYKLDN